MRSPLVALPLAALAVTMLAGCSSSSEEPAASSTDAQVESGACHYDAGSPAAKKDIDLPPNEPIAAKSATIATSAGNIKVTLNSEATPCTVSSFASLASQGYFDQTNCHRLTTEGIYVLQCGDPSGSGRGTPGYSFADEIKGDETYSAGTLAMANAGPDTNGSQFFLVYGDSPLSADYTVFGQMDEASTKIVSDIASKGVEGGGGDGAPAEAVSISSVSIEK